MLLVRVRIVIAAVAATLAAHRGASATWTSAGVPVCPFPECQGFNPIAVADGAGGAYVSWGDDRLGQGVLSTYVQRLTEQGSTAPGWPVLGARATVDFSGSTGYALLPDGAGGVYAAWGDFPSPDIYLQRIGGIGQLAPNWPPTGVLVCGAPGFQHQVAIADDGDGGVFLVWKDHRIAGESQADIYASRIQSDGTRAPGWPVDGVPICSAPFEQLAPRMISDGAGGFYASWDDGRTYPWDLYVHHIGVDGQPVPGWQTNGNLYRAGPYFEVIEALVPDDHGGVYVLWSEDPNDSSYEIDLYLLRIDADGAVSPGWPARGIPVCTAPGLQYTGYMTADGVGGAVMCWTDYRGGVYALRVQPDGSRAPGWPENGLRVRAGAAFDFSGPVAADGTGGAYFAMEQGTGANYVYVQHLNGAGTVPVGWPAIGLPVAPGYGPFQKRPSITSDGLGGCVVAWEDTRNVGTGIYAQKFGDDGPTPTLLSLVSFEAHPDRVALTWHRAGGDAREATVYRRTETVDWLPIGRASFEDSGVLQFEDRSVAAGRRYAYRLGVLENGAETFSTETWVDVPASLQLALDGLRPNPAVGQLRVSLTLPRQQRASLELLDVSGRTLTQREVGSLGPGSHLVSLGDTRNVAPGIYWLRLSTAEGSLVARAAVIR